ncbi:MAG: hypothetical protein WD097_10065 [Balneolales bacterium]
MNRNTTSTNSGPSILRKVSLNVLWLLLLLCISAGSSFSQITFGGLTEIEIRKGERDSSPYLNQTPSDQWTLFTPRVRLFFLADISPSWFVEGSFQADHYYSESLSNVIIAMLNVNWVPSSRENLRIGAGSFPTPFGAYASRIHQSNNPFIQLPLMYARGMPINRQTGIYQPGSSGGYDLNSYYGLSLVYRRAYSQGLLLHLADHRNQRYDLRLAATLMPVSGYENFGRYGRPALTARASFRPFIWLNTGISISHGAYLSPDNDTREMLDGVSFEQYTQTIVAANAEISYTYIRLLGEAGWNRWKVPDVDEYYELAEGPFNADAWFGMAELQFNFPFYPGMYSGFRAESIQPKHLGRSGGYGYGSGTETGMTVGRAWAYTTWRYEWVVGRKLTRDITLKTSYLLTDNHYSDTEDNVFSIQLSVMF